MSSYTTIQVIPPPMVETTVSGDQAVSLNRLLGPQGCELMHQTLERLSEANSPILGQLTEHLTGAEKQVETERLRRLFGWQRATESGTYSLTLQAADLPPEVAAQNVTSLRVELKVGTGLLETRFRHSALSEQTLSESARVSLTNALQRTVNRSVNRVLAVVVQQRLTERLREHLGQRQRQTVQSRVASEGTLRTYARARIQF